MKMGILLICLLAMIVAAGAESSKNMENISIGALVPVTGDWATSGEQAKAALEVGLADVNQFLKNIGSDKRVVLTVADTKADPTTGLEKLTALHEQGMNTVIVAGSSREVQAMKDYADENGVLLIASSSTASTLAIPGDNIYRLVTDDTHQGEVMEQVLASRNISAIVPMARYDVWADDLLKATEKGFSARNGTALDAIRYAPDSADYSASVKALSKRVKETVARFGADKVGVYLLSFEEGSKIMALAARDPVLSSVKWFGSDGIANQADLVENGTIADFAVKTDFVAPIYSGADNRQLYKDVSNSVMNATGSEPNAYAVTAYDALWIATEAKLLAGNGSISQLKAAYEQIADNYCGATGRTMLNEAGDRDFADYSLLAVKETNGKYAWKKVGLFFANYDESGFEWID
ncbi:MAG: ABC transporter substrate-binding protein [Methanothrix sp.]|nr:MAG: ABC transporter substrate-binding protein [Methanothrix sp.]